MPRPTEIAESHFRSSWIGAGRLLSKLPADSPLMPMAGVLYNMGQGLEQLSVGLRATYIELEEIKRILQQGR